MNALVLAELNIVAIIVTIVIGGICGFLAGQIMKGRGMGLVTNVIVGIVGAAIFSWLFGTLSLIDGVPYVNEIIGGTIGSVIRASLRSSIRVR